MRERASRAAAVRSKGETSVASSLAPGGCSSSAGGGGGGGGGGGVAAAAAADADAAGSCGGLGEALLEGRPLNEAPLLRPAKSSWAGSNEDPSSWELRAASALAVAIWARSPAMAPTEHTSFSLTFCQLNVRQ